MTFLPTGSTKPCEVTLDDISPRATLDVSDLRLAASSGGPIPVRNATANGQNGAPTVQFLLPHFDATATPTTSAMASSAIDGIALCNTAAGRTGYLRLSGPKSSLGAELLFAARRMVHHHLPGIAIWPQR